MTKDTEPQKLWALTKTEYAGQCTGYGSETVWLGLFPKLPDIKTLAPFIGPYLSEDIGVAIQEVQTLIDDKEITLKRNHYLDLSQVAVGVPLNP